MGCSLSGSSIHGVFPGKSAGVDCHFLLQGIFPTQESNPGLLHCRQTLYRLSHQGSPGKFTGCHSLHSVLYFAVYASCLGHPYRSSPHAVSTCPCLVWAHCVILQMPAFLLTTCIFSGLFVSQGQKKSDIIQILPVMRLMPTQSPQAGETLL